MTGDELVIVFAKPAVPGAVKTRLIPPFTAEQAAEFHLAALDDVLALVRRAVARVELHVAGDADTAAEFERRYAELPIRPQAPGDLGTRLIDSFDEALRGASARTVIIGSDHPTLPVEYLVQAFDALRSADGVFGPSRDGGYYLVGLRRDSWPQARAVFHEIPWSTPRVLETSLAHVASLGLDFRLLPEWYDVDRPSDLSLLRRDMDPESSCSRFLLKLD